MQKLWKCNRSNPSVNNLYRYLQEAGDTDIQIYYPEEYTFYPTNGALPSMIDLLLEKGNVNPSEPLLSHVMTITQLCSRYL